MASAIIFPIDLSPLAEIVPTCAISSEDCTFLARRSMSLTTAVAAISMPRFRSIGFIPAATSLTPSLMIEAVSTVAVVVPSPALSLVFEATSRTSWAPMFSNLSSSSISLATVTPSLVTRGAQGNRIWKNGLKVGGRRILGKASIRDGGHGDGGVFGDIFAAAGSAHGERSSARFARIVGDCAVLVPLRGDDVHGDGGVRGGQGAF